MFSVYSLLYGISGVYIENEKRRDRKRERERDEDRQKQIYKAKHTFVCSFFNDDVRLVGGIFSSCSISYWLKVLTIQ